MTELQQLSVDDTSQPPYSHRCFHVMWLFRAHDMYTTGLIKEQSVILGDSPFYFLARSQMG